MGRLPMYSGKGVSRTLAREFMTEYLIQAQWAEMVELKKIIHGLARAQCRRLSVLDIGIGDARIPKHLSGISEIWDLVESYDGIDNSLNVLKFAKKTVVAAGLEGKVKLIELDARNLQQISKKYDLVLCTYFTAGNFTPPTFSFVTGADGLLKNVPDLERNDAFRQVVNSAYGLLAGGGKLVLGSVYLDSESTRKKQEEFYRKCGMAVITPPNASFTATKEGFWSQRFTTERLLEYLNFAPSEKFEFRPLDTYGFAVLVAVAK